MDEIFIEGLHIDTIIGVYDYERTAKQPLIVDISFAYDLKCAGSSDNLAHTLDYANVVTYIQEFSTKYKFNLVESFAENLAQYLLIQFNLPSVSLKISKPQAIKSAKNVGVKITRLQSNIIVANKN